MAPQPHQKQHPYLACTAEEIAPARARLRRTLRDSTSRPVERIRAARMLAERNERANQPQRIETDSHHSMAL